MMICVDIGPSRFNFRAAGITVDDGHVLLCQSQANDSFWFLPGGRVDMMEPTPETLRREMTEELVTQVEVGPLRMVVENFFTLDGRPHHEIGFYYTVRFTDAAILDKSRIWHGVVDGSYKLNLRWFRLDELDQVVLRPAFLSQALRSPLVGVQHIINHS